jgi:hypothetical protein
MTTPCGIVATPGQSGEDRVISYDTEGAEATIPNPVWYGLSSYDVTFTFLDDDPAPGDVYQVELSWDDTPPSNLVIPKVSVSDSGEVTVISPQGRPMLAISETDKTFRLVLLDSRGVTQVVWHVAYDEESELFVANPEEACPMSFYSSNSIFDRFGDQSPCDLSVFMEAESIDSQEITKVTYDTALCNIKNSWIIYCPELSSVLKGVEGQTFGQKARRLSIPFNDLAEYSLLRLILSKFVFKSATFNVKYLRQSYYQEFIRLLTCKYPNFLAFFRAEPFVNYWKLFLA